MEEYITWVGQSKRRLQFQFKKVLLSRKDTMIIKELPMKTRFLTVCFIQELSVVGLWKKHLHYRKLIKPKEPGLMQNGLIKQMKMELVIKHIWEEQEMDGHQKKQLQQGYWKRAKNI